MISDENSFVSKLCATANEYIPNGIDVKNKDDDIKETNYDKWMKPNKCMLIICFFKEIKNKVDFEDNDNKHNMLTHNDDKEDEEEDEIKEHNKKLKRTKGKK